MAVPHLFRTYGPRHGVSRRRLGASRRRPVPLAHLPGMDTGTRAFSGGEHARGQLLEQVLSLSELCEHLHVNAQTIYDLRSQGRGPRGFRVGRELQFRVSEIQAWLTRMESDDEDRHPAGGQ